MTTDEFEAMYDPDSTLPTLPAEPKPKRRSYNRGKKAADPAPQSNGRQTSTKSNTVQLTAEQLARLWSIITGGSLIIDDTGDSPTFYVSMESFQQILPTLLEKL